MKIQALAKGDILVSIIVPCRNERDYIRDFVRNVFSQQPIDGNYELIIADGMSDDGTRKILEVSVEQYPRLVILDNTERTTPFALNRAISAAKGEIIIRMDVHTKYAPDYVKQCVAVLNETAADNVGGPWRAAGKTYRQEAIAIAFQSPFSSGGASSHALDYEGEVDTVYLGCWRKSTLEYVGCFDSELIRNQDDELNLRIIKCGGKIWQSKKIKSVYYPRSSLMALFKQYMQYGYWKVRVIQKHKIPASFRHLVPAVFVGTLLILMVFSLFYQTAMFCFYGIALLYGAVNLAAAVFSCQKKEKIKYLPLLPLVFALYHIGYGVGFLLGLLDFVVLCKGARHGFAKITRG